MAWCASHCTTSATNPHTARSSRFTLCDMALTSGAMKPITAPPRLIAAAWLPWRISAISRCGVSQMCTVQKMARKRTPKPKYAANAGSVERSGNTPFPLFSPLLGVDASVAQGAVASRAPSIRGSLPQAGRLEFVVMLQEERHDAGIELPARRVAQVVDHLRL